MDANKEKDLLEVIEIIQKRWGTAALRKGSQETTVVCIPTGFSSLDELLGGGVPCGRLTEIVGTPTSGMTTLALKVVAAAQRDNNAVVYVDLASAFDPDYAIQCEVNPLDLVLVRPKFAVALDILFDVVASGVPKVVVLNTFPGLSQKRRSKVALVIKRLHPILTRSHCALLLLTQPYTGSSLFQQYTAVRLLVEREEWLYHAHELQGYQAQVTVLKYKPEIAGKKVPIRVIFSDDFGGVRT